MRYLVLSVLLSLPFAACASNIKDTDLLTSNTLMLPPAKANTVFLQNRNSSDNQAVTLSDLGSRLTTKGYQVVQDPNIAYYIVLTNIVYCNLTKTELPVQDMVASGYGSGIGSSIMGGLQGLTSMASMAGPAGMMIGSVASTALDVGSSVGSLFSGGPSRPSANENMNYACVADLQITERKLGESLPAERQVAPSPGVYQTRLAASVDQKNLMNQKPHLWCSRNSAPRWPDTFKLLRDSR